MEGPLTRGGGGGGGGQPFSGRNSLTDHKKTSDVPLLEGIFKVFILLSPVVLYDVNDADLIRKQTVYAPGGLGQGALAYPQAWLTPGQLKFV